jgi:hypothetical protein
MAKQVTLGGMNYASGEENAARDKFVSIFRDNPIPDDQVLSNLGLFLTSKTFSRLLFMDFIYRQAVDVQGVIMDFGARWGQNMSLFTALRSIYEPYNRHKKVIGFDTFSGFPSIRKEDGNSEMIAKDNIGVTDNYVEYLNKVMQCQEGDNPLAHIKKYDFVVGDACKGILDYLDEYPETIVALAYFDFDLYEPTKKCLEAIKPRLVKGSVLGFDELNDHDSPGETKALMEIFDLNSIALKRYKYASRVSYFIVE